MLPDGLDRELPIRIAAAPAPLAMEALDDIAHARAFREPGEQPTVERDDLQSAAVVAGDVEAGEIGGRPVAVRCDDPAAATHGRPRSLFVAINDLRAQCASLVVFATLTIILTCHPADAQDPSRIEAMTFLMTGISRSNGMFRVRYTDRAAVITGQLTDGPNAYAVYTLPDDDCTVQFVANFPPMIAHQVSIRRLYRRALTQAGRVTLFGPGAVCSAMLEQAPTGPIAFPATHCGNELTLFNRADDITAQRRVMALTYLFDNFCQPVVRTPPY